MEFRANLPRNEYFKIDRYTIGLAKSLLNVTYKISFSNFLISKSQLSRIMSSSWRTGSLCFSYWRIEMKGMKMDSKIKYKLRTLYFGTCKDNHGEPFNKDLQHIASLMKAISLSRMINLGEIMIMDWGMEESLMKKITGDFDLSGVIITGKGDDNKRYWFKL